MKTYKIKHPPVSTANGLQWEKVTFSEEDASPLLVLGVIEEEATSEPLAEKTKPAEKTGKSSAALPNNK